MSLELRDSLAQVQELLGRATPGPWASAHSFRGVYSQHPAPGPVQVCRAPEHFHETWRGNAEAMVAAVNWLREHIPALLAMMEDHSPDAGKMGEEIFWHAGTQRPEPMTCDESGCTTGLVLVIHAPNDGGPSVRQGRYDHCLRGFFDSTTSQRIDPDQWTFAPQEAARAGERG